MPETLNSESIQSATDAFKILHGQGKPAAFVHLAVQIAASPDTLRQLIRLSTEHQPSNPTAQVASIDQWLSMYRSHRKMQDALAIADGITEELNASHTLDDVRQLSRMNEDELKAEFAESSQKELCQFLSFFQGIPFPPDESTLRNMLNALDMDSPCADSRDDGLFDQVLDSPEGLYYFRVWLPCWVLYRDYPPLLLRAARQGDIDSLDRLLRLDKYIVGDPAIAKRLGDYLTTGTAGQRRRLTDALKGKPKKRLTDKAIRSGLGTLISQLAYAYNTSVTAPQIEELFNRIERVRSGRLVDPAVPTGETWAKALQRNRNWPSLPTTKPDS